MEAASGLHYPVTVSNLPIDDLNFGITPFVQLTGKVFADIGGGAGGIANDGIHNGTEKGLANAKVKLTSADGATVYQTVTTGVDGSFALLIDNAIVDGTILKIVKTNPGSYISTGATVGNTAGTYDRASDTITFSYLQNTDYTGIAFGAVPLPMFETDGQQTGLPGTIIFFPHTFTAGSDGIVTFSTVGEASPALPGWVETIFLDANGNGTFDSGETLINGPLTVTAGQVVKILIKEFIPIVAPYDARNKITVTASFVYSGAPLPELSAILTRADLAISGEPTGSGLVLSKKVDKETALPGEELVYTLTYSNSSTEPLSNIVIHDATPEFTTFVSGTWSTPLPGSITKIVFEAPEEEVGALKWTFTGSLAPGATGTVTFKVKVAP